LTSKAQLYILTGVIRTFACKDTEQLHERKENRRFKNIANVALRKLRQIHTARELRDLNLAGNQLEKLSGNRKGQYSIRINDQWRVCFDWKDGDAENVEITDYH
jgi:toxin HigB-1